MPVRCILNTTGTACHVSSVLVVLCHCFFPDREQLFHSQSSSPSSSPILRFLCQYTSNTNTTDPFDPTWFYNWLQIKLHINANELGDAMSALCRLLEPLREDPAITLLCDTGRVYSMIQQQQIDNSMPIRSKQTRTVQMPCPFPLEQNASLEASLTKKLQPLIVSGYKWSNSINCETPLLDDNNNSPLPDDCNDDSSGTTKQMCIDALPVIWCFQLNRFVCCDHEANGGQVKAIDQPFFIPLEFMWTCADNQSFSQQEIQQQQQQLSSNSVQYQLRGGILHVSDDDDGDHNVALVYNDNAWFLVDDDQVDDVDESTVLNLMSGCTHDGRMVRGICAIYHSNTIWEERTSSSLPSSLDNHLPTLVPVIDWDQPESFLGRRLSVRWTHNNMYDGFILNYNPVTGKHTVQYDDGDVKEYKLSKKTIEWLS